MKKTKTQKRAEQFVAVGGVVMALLTTLPECENLLREEYAHYQCDEGVAQECLTLAERYNPGEEGGQDMVIANGYYFKACLHGSANGCSALGVSYKKGRGVEKDLTQAIALFEEACDGGHLRACNHAGFNHNPTNPSLAATFYKKACDKDYARGCARLGRAYDEGLGLPKDPKKARDLHSKACTLDKKYCTSN